MDILRGFRSWCGAHIVEVIIILRLSVFDGWHHGREVRTRCEELSTMDPYCFFSVFEFVSLNVELIEPLEYWSVMPMFAASFFMHAVVSSP